jgi:hypothetical protein
MEFHEGTGVVMLYNKSHQAPRVPEKSAARAGAGLTAYAKTTMINKKIICMPFFVVFILSSFKMMTPYEQLMMRKNR